MPSRDNSIKTLRFGIPSLDQLIHARRDDADQTSAETIHGFPLNDPTTPGTHESVSICILGTDGTGKSVLAMHLAARYRADVVNVGQHAHVWYASTDLSFDRAAKVWKDFGLVAPDIRVEDPFARQRVSEKTKPTKKTDDEPPKNSEPYVPLTRIKPDFDNDLEQLLDEPTGNSSKPTEPTVADVKFIDLAQKTMGDDWGFLDRLLAVMPDPDGPPHMLIIDAIEGLEVMNSGRDAYGELLDRRSRVARVIRAAAHKCHVVLVVERATDERNPEEFVSDIVIQLRFEKEQDYMRRILEIDKVRGVGHVRGRHDFLIRTGAGSTTGKEYFLNPDDPQVNYPKAKIEALRGAANRSDHSKRDDSPIDLENEANDTLPDYQAYMKLTPSLHAQSRQIMREHGPRFIPSPDQIVCNGFGITHLDEMLLPQPAPLVKVMPDPQSDEEVQSDPDETDSDAQSTRQDARPQRGLPSHEPAVLIGEDATGKSKVAKAFLGQAVRPGLKDHEQGVAILLTTKTLDTATLAERLAVHLDLSKEKKQEFLEVHTSPQGRVICRRLEIHHLGGPGFMHIVSELVRCAQQQLQLVDDPDKPKSKQEAERRKQGWRIRLVIDNWSTICDTYPELEKNPRLLPCLLFMLRREGVASLIIATENRGFSSGFNLDRTRILRDLTSVHIFLWRVSFFGENRIAITVNPPLTHRRRQDVIRGLLTYRTAAEPENRNSENPLVAVDPNFELYTGLTKGKPAYVKLKVYLFLESNRNKRYLKNLRLLYSKLTAQKKKDVFNLQSPENYEHLREFSGMQGASNYDHTVVIQVDEFWAKVNGPLSLRNQYAYLTARTAIQHPSSEGDLGAPMIVRYEDPLAVFQPANDDCERRKAVPETAIVGANEWTRADLFSPVGYTMEQHLKQHKKSIVKVPYAWDFGFLMIHDKKWQEASKKRKAESGPVSQLVPKIHASLREQLSKTHSSHSWREFLEACDSVAKIASTGSEDQKYRAFDIAPRRDETLSCLMLEVWASEIQRKGLDIASAFSLYRHDSESLSLTELIEEHEDELFAAWLLLTKVFQPSDFTADKQMKKNRTMWLPSLSVTGSVLRRRGRCRVPRRRSHD